MFDNFTDTTKELIYDAQNLALENHNTLIEPIHILSAISKSSMDNIVSLLAELKLNTNLFSSDIQNALNNLAKINEITDKIYLSKNCLMLFELASQKAQELKDKYDKEHFLEAYLDCYTKSWDGVVHEYLESIHKKIYLNGL